MGVFPELDDTFVASSSVPDDDDSFEALFCSDEELSSLPESFTRAGPLLLSAIRLFVRLGEDDDDATSPGSDTVPNSLTVTFSLLVSSSMVVDQTFVCWLVYCSSCNVTGPLNE